MALYVIISGLIIHALIPMGDNATYQIGPFISVLFVALLSYGLLKRLNSARIFVIIFAVFSILRSLAFIFISHRLIITLPWMMPYAVANLLFQTGVVVYLSSQRGRSLFVSVKPPATSTQATTDVKAKSASQSFGFAIGSIILGFASILFGCLAAGFYAPMIGTGAGSFFLLMISWGCVAICYGFALPAIGLGVWAFSKDVPTRVSSIVGIIAAGFGLILSTSIFVSRAHPWLKEVFGKPGHVSVPGQNN